MSGRVAKQLRRDTAALLNGIDPSSEYYRQAFHHLNRHIKRLYYRPNAAEGGYNVYGQTTRH